MVYCRCSAVDRGDVALLAHFDVKAAFDTVDHSILLERLSTSFGLSGQAHAWFDSYISGRSQSVRLGGTSSPRAPVRFGIPQGSVLGPILYVLYTADVARIVESFGLKVHLYADDTQIYGSSSVSRSVELSELLLLPDETEFIWFGTRHQLSNLNPRSISVIHSSTSVRDLGVLFDSELTMERHISKLCQSCFFQLRRLRSIRHSLSRHALLPYACACFHLLAARLLQQRFVWCQCLPPRSSSIHSQRCGKAYFESLEVRSYLRRYAKRVTLAPYCATYQLQDLPSRAQLSGGYWSNVPIRILQPGELRGRKTSSSFCCTIRSGGASIPPWTLWSSRFLSRGAASMELTSSRHSELWNWTEHFQEETKNFFNAAVADSASEVSMHQRRYTNTRYYYYYYS